MKEMFYNGDHYNIIVPSLDFLSLFPAKLHQIIIKYPEEKERAV